MILSRDQINRYLRHIIIPEISGQGQKKIIESRVFIYAPSAEKASSLIYYLAASGAGYIYCYFEDKSGYDDLCNSIRDFNGDVILELSDNNLCVMPENTFDNKAFSARILLSEYESLDASLKNFVFSKNSTDFVPVIIAVNSGWKGFLQVFKNQEDFNSLFSAQQFPVSDAIKNNFYEEGLKLSDCLMGTLAAIEYIKLCLNMGTILEKPLWFNLLSMQFNKPESSDFYKAISDFIMNNTAINMNTYKKLSESKVLIVGTGGLGSPVAYALASIGIGTIGVVDYDKVEISNLNRQIVHSVSRINMPKVKSAEIFIKKLNPEVNVVTYSSGFNTDNAIDIIKDYDVIVDAVDNFPTRYLLNDSCFFAGKTLVDAAAVKFQGLIMTIVPKEGPCYRCAFPVMPQKKGSMSCSEAGVLGPVPGVMGFMQAAEVVKAILSIGDSLRNRIIYYDAMDTDFDTISINKAADCALCGTHPTISELTQYEDSCESRKGKY